MTGSLICYDELVTAPVLVTPVRKVPADDDGNLSAPEERRHRTEELNALVFTQRQNETKATEII